MLHECIYCGETWGFEEGDDGLVSSGMCDKCAVKILIPKIKARQISEGNFPCCGTADKYCDQAFCKYKEICVGVNK